MLALFCSLFIFQYVQLLLVAVIICSPLIPIPKLPTDVYQIHCLKLVLICQCAHASMHVTHCQSNGFNCIYTIETAYN